MTKNIQRRKTVLRDAFLGKSHLQPLVKNGLQAMGQGHASLIDSALQSDFEDSIDLDAAMKDRYPNDNRWDYLLGHGPSREVIAVEPHSAKNDEISTVIGKKAHAISQLNGHLCNGKKITKWLWVTSGKVHFADTEKARRQADQKGIEFVGTKIMAKHIPSVVVAIKLPKTTKMPKKK